MLWFRVHFFLLLRFHSHSMFVLFVGFVFVCFWVLSSFMFISIVGYFLFLFHLIIVSLLVSCSFHFGFSFWFHMCFFFVPSGFMFISVRLHFAISYSFLLTSIFWFLFHFNLVSPPRFMFVSFLFHFHFILVSPVGFVFVSSWFSTIFFSCHFGFTLWFRRKRTWSLGVRPEWSENDAREIPEGTESEARGGGPERIESEARGEARRKRTRSQAVRS